MATILAFALLPLSGFATDIYIPSLPSMAANMRITELQAQFTLTLFLISYGVSQLFVGTFLDAFGRYKISLAALLVFVTASLVIANSHNIHLIYAMRVVHGIAVAAIVVAKRAFFVDMFSGDKLKNYLSLFTIIWSTGPIVAPFIGGYVQVHLGWEANFYFLALLGGVLFLLELLFGFESIQHITAFKLKSIVSVYMTMFKTLSFSLGLIILGLAYTMVMVYNMSGPFIIEHHFGLSPVIAGYSSLLLGLAWMSGGFIGKGLIQKPFVRKMNINLFLQLITVVLMLTSTIWYDNIILMLFFAFLIHVGAGFTYNNYFTYCLGRFPKNAGIAGGLTGGICYVIVSLLSYFTLRIFPAVDAVHLGDSYLLLILLSIPIMLAVWKLKEKI